MLKTMTSRDREILTSRYLWRHASYQRSKDRFLDSREKVVFAMNPTLVMYLHFGAKFLMAPFRVIATSVGRISSLLSAETFLLWSFVVGYFQKEILASHLEVKSALVCLLSSLCILVMEWLLKSSNIYRILSRVFLRDVLSVLVYLTSPIILIFYMWNPLYASLPCIIRTTVSYSVSKFASLKPALWTSLASCILLSAVYKLWRKRYRRYSRNKSSRSLFAESTPRTPVTRSMSARLRQMKRR